MQGHEAVAAGMRNVDDSLTEIATWGRVRGALAELAAWGSHALNSNDPLEALMAVASGEPCPSRVTEAVDVLRDLSVPLGDRAKRYSLAAAFEDLESTDPQAFAIFRRRKLSSTAPTLQSLAEELGVTRERVRQIEQRMSARIGELMQEPGDWPIGAAAVRARSALGPIADVAQLDSVSRLIDPDGEALRHPHRLALILMLAGPYQRVDNCWLVTEAGLSTTESALEQATSGGATDLDTVAELLLADGVQAEVCNRWIQSQAGYRVLEGKVARWGGSLADKAEAVLSIAGEPLTPEQIFERIGEPHKNFRGFKGQLGDSRFRRRALNLYGLTDWGGEEYTKLADEMTEELERKGGSMELDELAATMARNFGVSESSVRMYASGPQFNVDSQQRVTRRDGDLPLPESAPLSLSRGCFRLRDGWAFRRTVDRDVTRGSGSGLPIAFAKELGLRPEDSLKLEAPFGGITCSWPSHTAHMGSLRAASEALGAVEGDYLFVVHIGGGRLDIRLVCARDCASESGYRRLALECGRDIVEDAASEVAAALALHDSDPQPAAAIRLRLRERGELQLAELVPDEPPHDGLLDALASLGG